MPHAHAVVCMRNLLYVLSLCTTQRKTGQPAGPLRGTRRAGRAVPYHVQPRAGTHSVVYWRRKPRCRSSAVRAVPCARCGELCFSLLPDVLHRGRCNARLRHRRAMSVSRSGL